MALLDKHNRSEDEVTETLEATILEDGKNNATTSLKQLPLVSVTFTFLALSALMGLSFVLFTERSPLPSIATVPLSLELMGPRIDTMQLLHSQGSYCLIESSLEVIRVRVKNGDSVAMQLKEYTDDQFVAVAMDQTNDHCFLNAQGRRVCVLPSALCGEDIPVVPRNRNLFTDEEYDIRCQAYIAANQEEWEYILSLIQECAAGCQGLLGCPCTCISSPDPIPPDFVVPDDFVPRPTSTDDSISDVPSSAPYSDPSLAPFSDPSPAPSNDPTRVPNPCRLGNGKKMCRGPHN